MEWRLGQLALSCEGFAEMRRLQVFLEPVEHPCVRFLKKEERAGTVRLTRIQQIQDVLKRESNPRYDVERLILREQQPLGSAAGKCAISVQT